MTQKHASKITALILSLVLFTSVTGVSAQSVQTPIPIPSSTVTVSSDSNYIDYVTALLTISGGTAYCTSGCQCYTSTSNSAKVMCELQYYSGGEWLTFNSWIHSGGYNLSFSPSQGNLYHGYTYRVKTTGFAYYNNVLMDTLTGYSKTVYYN